MDGYLVDLKVWEVSLVVTASAEEVMSAQEQWWCPGHECVWEVCKTGLVLLELAEEGVQVPVVAKHKILILKPDHVK
jgi:hypothetical protein